jgi:hypothetical protein
MLAVVVVVVAQRVLDKAVVEMGHQAAALLAATERQIPAGVVVAQLLTLVQLRVEMAVQV